MKELPEEVKAAIREQLELNFNQDPLAAVMLLSSLLYYAKDSDPSLCNSLFQHPVIDGNSGCF